VSQTNAAIEASIVELPITSAERPLGVGVTRDLKAFRAELLLPFGIGLHDFGNANFSPRDSPAFENSTIVTSCAGVDAVRPN